MRLSSFSSRERRLIFQNQQPSESVSKLQSEQEQVEAGIHQDLQTLRKTIEQKQKNEKEQHADLLMSGEQYTKAANEWGAQRYLDMNSKIPGYVRDSIKANYSKLTPEQKTELEAYANTDTANAEFPPIGYVLETSLVNDDSGNGIRDTIVNVRLKKGNAEVANETVRTTPEASRGVVDESPIYRKLDLNKDSSILVFKKEGFQNALTANAGLDNKIEDLIAETASVKVAERAELLGYKKD